MTPAFVYPRGIPRTDDTCGRSACSERSDRPVTSGGALWLVSVMRCQRSKVSEGQTMTFTYSVMGWWQWRINIWTSGLNQISETSNKTFLLSPYYHPLKLQCHTVMMKNKDESVMKTWFTNHKGCSQTKHEAKSCHFTLSFLEHQGNWLKCKMSLILIMCLKINH